MIRVRIGSLASVIIIAFLWLSFSFALALIGYGSAKDDVTTAVAARDVKYTFSDVEYEGELYEIEASYVVRKDFAQLTCVHYTNNYVEFLGMGTVPTHPGLDAGQIFDYCVSMLPYFTN